MHSKNYLKFKFMALQIIVLLLSISLSQLVWSQDYLADAKQYLQKGEFKSAVIQLKNALQENSENAEARFMLGEIYVLAGDGASAEKELLRAEKLGIERDTMLVALARAYLLQGQWAKVLDVEITDALSVELRATLLALKGQAYLAMQQLEDAREEFQKAIKVLPASIDAILGFARLALIEKNFDVAARHIGHVLDLDSVTIEAWLLKGDLERTRKDYPAAKAAFQEVLNLDNNNLQAHIGKAAVQVALGQLDEAMANVKAVQALFPGHPLANYLSGAIFFEKRDLVSAQESLQLVLRAVPNHYPSLLLLGGIFYVQGEQLEQAANHLSRYVTAIPNHLPARKLLAAIYLKTREADKAIAVLENVLNQTDDDSQLLSMLGSAYMQKKDFERGIEFFEKAVAIDPDIAVTRTQLALSHLATGETDQAISELETAVDMGQGLLQADVLLILMRINQKNFDIALQLAEKLAKTVPDNPVPHNLQGVIHLGQVQPAAARKSFEQALQIEPMFFSAAMSLARMDELDGNEVGARQRYKDILSKNQNYLAAMLSLARLDEKAGDQEASLNWVELAREKNPNALEPGLILARYYLKKGDKLKSVVMMRELYNVFPDHPLVLELLGEAQLANDEPSNALVTFKRLVDLHSGVPRAYYMLGVVNKRMKDDKAAVKNFNKALELQPDFIQAQLALLDLILSSENKEEALGIAIQIQKQRPDSALGYIVEGDIHSKLKSFGDAEKAYSVAFQKEESSKLALKLFAVKKKLGNEANARKILQQWLGENKDDVNVGLILAMSYQENDLVDQAIKTYQHILSVQPKNMMSLNNLAWLYDTKGDKRGVQFAERAYALAPENPAVVDTYGWLLLHFGEVNKGLTLIQGAAIKAPHMLEIRYHLAVALNEVGRKDEARKELQRLLRNGKAFNNVDDAKALLKQLE